MQLVDRKQATGCLVAGAAGMSLFSPPPPKKGGKFKGPFIMQNSLLTAAGFFIRSITSEEVTEDPSGACSTLSKKKCQKNTLLPLCDVTKSTHTSFKDKCVGSAL